jgi:integrase
MPLRFARLSRPSIRRLKLGEKITEHGISAERLKDGDIRYSVNIMVDGERIHRVVGRESNGTTRTQAEDFISKTRADARDGRLQLPKGRKTPLTFAKAAKRYLEGEREVGAKDMASKEGHLRLHLVPYFGSMRVERISKFTVEKFRNKLRQKGMAEGGIIRVLATFRHMGNRLANKEPPVIPAPFKMPTLGKTDNRRDYVLTPEGMAALLDAALNDSNSYIWLFIKMGLSTSLRHSEILSARFELLNEHRRRLRVRVKGGKWRDQPLSREMTETLIRERGMAAAPGIWIFPNPAAESGHMESMKKAFRRCVIRAGLDPTKVIPHTMRHSAITAFAETGADVRTIQKFSGHETLDMVYRYTHARDTRVDDALEKMERGRTEPEQIGHRNPKNS